MRLFFTLLLFMAPLIADPPFTGKVVRNKVRLRLQPNLESKILQELNKGDLLIVTEASEDFYAVKPPMDVKGYVFRTFVLDNVVEGNRVNIRLEPDTEAIVIGQLNKGAQIQGTISSLNNKWLEIALPEDVRFYVSKEYVEKIGDGQLFGQLHKRKEEVQKLLDKAKKMAQEQIEKPFLQIQLEPVYSSLNRLINHFTDFPEQVAKAKELLNQTQESYLQKKISYLEEKAKGALQVAPAPKSQLHPKMAAWIPVEAQLFENHSEEGFYANQRQEAIVLSGTVQPYIRSVRNKPGDYLLMVKGQPSAFLYSTQVDLEKQLGKEVRLLAASRPNYNFAFPAYFVLNVE